MGSDTKIAGPFSNVRSGLWKKRQGHIYKIQWDSLLCRLADSQLSPMRCLYYLLIHNCKWPCDDTNIKLSLGTLEPLEGIGSDFVHVPDFLRCSTGPGNVAVWAVCMGFRWGSEKKLGGEEAGFGLGVNLSGRITCRIMYFGSITCLILQLAPFLSSPWMYACRHGSEETYGWSSGLPGAFDLSLAGCLHPHTPPQHAVCILAASLHGIRWWKIGLCSLDIFAKLTTFGTTLDLITSWILGCHLFSWQSICL